MMDLYSAIFRRKSMRKFPDNCAISKEELAQIQQIIADLTPLIPDIKTETFIIPVEETTCKWGEYCLIIYSEEKDNYLLNAGYLFQQLDLALVEKNIGTCWHGIGKVKSQPYSDLKYVIMFTLGKVTPDYFRKDLSETKRKETDVVWQTSTLLELGNLIRYAPSACNSQPWVVKQDQNKLQIYRNTLAKSIMPRRIKTYFNTIDMGIFLCYLEIVFRHNHISFSKTILSPQDPLDDLILIAEYHLD